MPVQTSTIDSLLNEEASSQGTTTNREKNSSLSWVTNPLGNLADVLAPYDFYIVGTADNANQNQNDQLRSLSLKEKSAYILRTKKIPKNPKLALVASGGTVKGYIGVGVKKAFHEAGISIDEYHVCSVSSLFVVDELTGSFDEFERFALKVPELLPQRPSILSPLEWITRGKTREKLHLLGQFVNLIKLQKQKLPDGTYIKTNRGMVQSEEFESHMRRYSNGMVAGDLPNFHIYAIEYSTNGLQTRLVDFTKDFPEMPIHLAVRAGISNARLLALTFYDGHIFGDAGLILNFPLREGTIHPDITTVIALDLHYNSKNVASHEYGGLRGIFNIDDEVRYLRDRERTEMVTQIVTGRSLEELSSVGDRNHHKYFIATPNINGIKPNITMIDIQERKRLIQEGYAFGKMIVQKFRRLT